MKNGLTSKYIQVLDKRRIYHSPKSLVWFYDRYLFQGSDVQGKNVLDIGGGIGLLSFYAAIKGASKVDLVEPEADGSGSFPIKHYYTLRTELKPISDIVHKLDLTFQDFQADDHKYDFIFLYASVNHLDEDSCSKLLYDRNAREKYISMFRKMKSMARGGAQIVIIDCPRKNFFDCIGLKCPFANSITWSLHQDPHIWAKLMMQSGFHSPRVRYLPFKQLRRPGALIMGNKIANFFIGSLFALTMEAD